MRLGATGCVTVGKICFVNEMADKIMKPNVCYLLGYSFILRALGTTNKVWIINTKSLICFLLAAVVDIC